MWTPAARAQLARGTIPYATCLTDAEWALVRPFMPAPGQTGRPRRWSMRHQSLFKFVGEKIPYEFLGKVDSEFRRAGVEPQGVYIAHDSMGYPRYIGRGNIFSRLRARKKAQELELSYFSFFVVESKTHEREIETIMIRAAGPLLDFNMKKVRSDIQAGDVKDFEAGTKFVERQYRRGKKLAARPNAGL